MKKNLHPTVRQVVFKDVSSDFSFLGTSTMNSKETIKWEDGKSYPLIKVEISSALVTNQRFPRTSLGPFTSNRNDRLELLFA